MQQRHTPGNSEEPNKVPPRRRGGQELPDDVQDRPEQNAGYDAAVHGEDADVRRRSDLADVIPEEAGSDVENIPPADGENAGDEIDRVAEADAAREVRRRERTARVSKH